MRSLLQRHSLFYKPSYNLFEINGPGLLSGLKVPYQVDITELVQPEVVDGGCDGWEVVGLEASITETNSGTQSR